MAKHLLFSFLLLAPFASRSQDLISLTFPSDAKGFSLGYSGISTDNDANSSQWNPGKLGHANSLFGISGTHMPLRVFWGPTNSWDVIFISGYAKVHQRHTIGLSVKHFDYGYALYNPVTNRGIFKAYELGAGFSYAFKISEKWSMGTTVRNIRSVFFYKPSFPYKNINSYSTDFGVLFRSKTKGDDKFSYRSQWGAALTNLGPKVTSVHGYSNFIPTNFGTGITLHLAFGNQVINITTELNKFLLPSYPQYDTIDSGAPRFVNGQNVIIKGKDPHRPVGNVLYSSFYDAPGGLKEELTEINRSVGLEYCFKNALFVRSGFFLDPSFLYGNRSFATFGFGIKVQGIDLAAGFEKHLQNYSSSALTLTAQYNFNPIVKMKKNQLN